MYTAPATAGAALSDRQWLRIGGDRKLFEAQQLQYYATHNAKAEQLSKYIFSMSAAISAEALSNNAPHMRRVNGPR
jgi:hypothetical protein